MRKAPTRLPKEPGVYLFKDESGRVLYVGKAVNLASRVRSYFCAPRLDLERPWTAVMVGLAQEVETIIVSNETEALMLEATLIKRHQPRFNVKLTDDKSYPYLRLTLDEQFPRLQLIRSNQNWSGRLFGPYLSAWSARLTAEYVRYLYGVHIGNQPLKPGADRPCLACQLDKNRCPQAGQISQEEYRTKVEQAVKFLTGGRQEAIKRLEARMQRASKRQQFELAARLRDLNGAIKQTGVHQAVISPNSDNYDIIAVSQSLNLAVIAVWEVREGKLSQTRNFYLASGLGQAETAVTRGFLLSFYDQLPNRPRLILLGEPIEDQEKIGQLITATVRPTKIQVAKRGTKRKLYQLALKNAWLQLEERLAKNDQAVIGLSRLAEILNLHHWPSRIEAVDISNLGASETVGATVCFIEGKPVKKEYRRYKIRTVSGQNDFQMIAEITARRFNDAARPKVDLYVVDGGPEQLAAASRALQFTASQPRAIIALAKKPDRIFRPGSRQRLKINPHDTGLRLLAGLRDEAHRFSLSYQRLRQRKRSLRTG